MTDWLTDFAEELSKEIPATAIDLPPEDKNALLRIARDVAHGTERKNAPLATFIIGRFVQATVAQGGSVTEALERARTVVARILPSVEAEPS